MLNCLLALSVSCIHIWIWMWDWICGDYLSILEAMFFHCLEKSDVAQWWIWSGVQQRRPAKDTLASSFPGCQNKRWVFFPFDFEKKIFELKDPWLHCYLKNTFWKIARKIPKRKGRTLKIMLGGHCMRVGLLFLNVMCSFLDCGWKMENLEKTHTGTERTGKLHK